MKRRSTSSQSIRCLYEEAVQQMAYIIVENGVDLKEEPSLREVKDQSAREKGFKAERKQLDVVITIVKMYENKIRRRLGNRVVFVARMYG